MPQRLLLLGRDYCAYGAMTAVEVGGHTAAAMSVGSDPASPSHVYKADPDVPNEDALCVIETTAWSGLAVADAHFGSESSHLLIERLHNTWATVRPRDSDHLAEMVDSLRIGDRVTTESETTLLIVVFDRQTRTGFGLSFGDSSFAIVGSTTDPVAINPRNRTYLHPARRRGFLQGEHFAFEAAPGDVLLAYTDGIDECHYGSPNTSLQPHHMAAIAHEADYVPLAIATAATDAALRGVDGHPGGQDNIAIIASAV